MHELALCRNIIDIVQEFTLTRHHKVIKNIYIEVGELVAVDKTAMLFNFAIVTKGTAIENAGLYIIDIPAMGKCELCGKMLKVCKRFEFCDNCQALLVIVQGMELRVKEIEVE